MHQPPKEKALKIIPLGGLGEVGRNMTLLEYQGQILIIDMGLSFPDENMPGVDYIIPNTAYLHQALKDKKRIVGILFTHGHYDHIGAVPYILPRIGFDHPMYGSELTKGIILKRQEDFPRHPKLKINTLQDLSALKLGCFEIEAFRLNHNVPGDLGFFIRTPVGNICHVPDFKFDDHPVNDLPTDFDRLKALGRRNIHLLMMDSTGAEEEGHSLSERDIFKNLKEIFEKEKRQRIIAATFASLLNRVQQVITLSEEFGRKVVIEGYSMKTNVEIAKKMGYLKFNQRTIIQAKEASKLKPSKITVISTGAQGEEEAALMRLATGQHKFLTLGPEDTVIFSSSIVPGNERAVQMLKDQLYRLGAHVYHYKMMDIHAGGHAQREELAEMMRLLKPAYFMPMHGQYSMLVEHAKLAQKVLNLPPENTIVAENGQVVEASSQKVILTKEEVPCSLVMVDGLGIGDVGQVVLRDRQTLAEDGMFVIIALVDRKRGKVRSSPDIISRGFVYLKESKNLLFEARKRTIEIINRASGNAHGANWLYVKEEVRNKLGDFLFTKTHRRPMILPVIIEV